MVSLVKNTPLMEMGEQLAADKLKRMGCRWSLEKPQARKSDQSSDCVPQCLQLQRRQLVAEGPGEGCHSVVFGLSSSIVIGTHK